MSHPWRFVRVPNCFVDAEGGSYLRHNDGVPSGIEDKPRDISPLLAMGEGAAEYDTSGVLDQLVHLGVVDIRTLFGGNSVELDGVVNGRGNVDYTRRRRALISSEKERAADREKSSC